MSYMKIALSIKEQLEKYSNVHKSALIGKLMLKGYDIKGIELTLRELLERELVIQSANGVIRLPDESDVIRHSD